MPSQPVQPAQSQPVQSPPLISMRGIVKRFGGVTALDGVDFSVQAGEVHSLVGDNGAGKSTLIKILCGVYEPDQGDILIEGQRVTIRNPRDARQHGIEVIYQDLALVDEFSAVDNLYLGKEPRLQLGSWRLPLLDRGQMMRGARDIFKRVNINIPNLRQQVFYLSGGQRQGVAIGRAINAEQQIRLLIMDEPTAALGVEETGKVLELIRNLKAQGVTILVISHNLDDVFAVSDRVTALKTGRWAATLSTHQSSKEEVVSYIVGAKRAERGGGVIA